MVNGQEWARDVVDYGTVITLREYTLNTDETFSGLKFEDGETYKAMPAHDVVVIGMVTSSIQKMLTDMDNVDVYDLNGRLIYRNIDIKNLRKILRTGVYIITGHKIAM